MSYLSGPMYERGSIGGPEAPPVAPTVPTAARPPVPATQFALPENSNGPTPFGTAEPVSGSSPFATTPATAGMSIGLGVASDILSNIQAQNATAAQERQGQIEAGMNERERYWFDPNSDVIPTLSEYMDGMPSQRDALLESGLFGKAGNTRGGRVAASFANPIAAGQNAYIQDKSGQMALSGASKGMSIGGGLGAAVGAVAGAIVGLIEGAVGWNAAKAVDKTARNQRRRQYFAKVKAWYATRRKQIAEARKAQAADMRSRLTAGSLSNIQRSQAIGAAKKEEKKQSREENRVNVLNMLQNAMQAQELMRSEGLKNTTVGRRAIA